MKRSEVLAEAEKCVCGQREQDYGTTENNFETIGLLWGVYLNAAHPNELKNFAINGITAEDVAVMMSLLKVARIATGSSPDSFVDLAGYAACAGEIVTQASEQQEQTTDKNTCVICGAPITKGRQHCLDCARRICKNGRYA